MKARKYSNIKVTSHVYVTSLCHYWFHVYGDEHERRLHLDYDPTFGFVTPRVSYPRLPKYVEREVCRIILERAERGEFVFYEHYQDGGQRWENLRYHDAEGFESVLSIARRIVAGSLTTAKS